VAVGSGPTGAGGETSREEQEMRMMSNAANGALRLLLFLLGGGEEYIIENKPVARRVWIKIQIGRFVSAAAW
jgi:hypothetical protein